jgi:hypothetical protein
MSSHDTGASAPGSEVAAEISWPLTPDTERELCNTREFPSIQAQRELLDSAFVATVRRLGCPIGEAAEKVFNAELDALFRQLMCARRPARIPDVEWRLRAALAEAWGS